MVWGRDGSDAFIAALVDDAVRAVERLLAHRLTRALHVVAYASNEEACRALDRRVPATMLLAPLHTSTLALVALQAPSVDPRNGDVQRMRRLLCHELAHVLVAERTGSVKRLGDGNRGMRVSSWVDEGLAVCVAAAAAQQPDVIDAALERSAAAALSEDALAAAFDDLTSRDRDAAFAVATARIWRAVQAHGFRFVFAGL
ncbi:MAG TPA: hypothetical protein VF334_20300 [Polyangia bacterium]